MNEEIELRERIRKLFERYEDGPSERELTLAMEFEQITGFEPLYLEEVETPRGFREAMTRNVVWFCDWSIESANQIECRIDKLEEEDENSNAGLAGPALP